MHFAIASTLGPVDPTRAALPFVFAASALQAKGLVTREERGRAFVYEAAVDESELAARRIIDVLSSVRDRDAVLAGFVGNLSKREAKALRALLDGPAK